MTTLLEEMEEAVEKEVVEEVEEDVELEVVEEGIKDLVGSSQEGEEVAMAEGGGGLHPQIPSRTFRV